MYRHGLRQRAVYTGGLPVVYRFVCADLLANLFRRIRHIRRQQNAANADGLQQVVHDTRQTRLVCLILCQHPRSGLVNVLIGTGYNLENLNQAVLECIRFHDAVVLVTQSGSHRNQLVIQCIGSLLSRQCAVKILLNHGNGTGNQIAQIVCQIRVDAVNQRLIGERTVRTERELAHQEVTQGIYAVALTQKDRIDNVALGLGHLAAVQQQPAMAVNLLRQRQIQCHQNCRPQNRVETHNFLADEMNVSRPELLKVVVLFVLIAQRRDVVGQRVNPYVYDVLRIRQHRNTPVKAGTGYTGICQTRLDEVVEHLMRTRGRLQPIRMLLVQLDDAILILGKTEEICFFLCVYNLAAAVRALAVYQLCLGPERLTRLAVLALVHRLVNIALILQALKNLLYGFFMIRIGRADKAVIGNVHQLPQILDAAYNLIDKFLRRHAGFLCLVLNLLTVFIRTGQEHDIIALQALKASHSIGCHGTVAMADVQVIRRVVNRSSYIKRFFLQRNRSFTSYYYLLSYTKTGRIIKLF